MGCFQAFWPPIRPQKALLPFVRRSIPLGRATITAVPPFSNPMPLSRWTPLKTVWNSSAFGSRHLVWDISEGMFCRSVKIYSNINYDNGRLDFVKLNDSDMSKDCGKLDISDYCYPCWVMKVPIPPLPLPFVVGLVDSKSSTHPPAIHAIPRFYYKGYPLSWWS